MSDIPFFQIDFSSSDIARIQAKLADLPDGCANAGVVASTNYLLGVLVNKEIPESKSVFKGSRTAAYGVPFFTDKQRKFFFAQIADNLPYVRGGKSSGMESKWYTVGSGKTMRIVNYSKAAFYVYDNIHQARQLALAGWKKMEVIIKDYTPQTVRSFVNAVNQYIKKVGLS
jgi:hypothetical protein